MTYKQLKDFCNSLNSEQLKKEVLLSIVERRQEKITDAFLTREDEYFDAGHSLGTLEEIKAECPNDWEDVINLATVHPKGIPVLVSK